MPQWMVPARRRIAAVGPQGISLASSLRRRTHGVARVKQKRARSTTEMLAPSARDDWRRTLCPLVRFERCFGGSSLEARGDRHPSSVGENQRWRTYKVAMPRRRSFDRRPEKATGCSSTRWPDWAAAYSERDRYPRSRHNPCPRSTAGGEPAALQMWARPPFTSCLISASGSSAVNIEANPVEVYPSSSGIDQERAVRAHLGGREARRACEVEVPSPTRSSAHGKSECLCVSRASSGRRNDAALGPNLRTDLAICRLRRRFALRPRRSRRVLGRRSVADRERSIEIRWKSQADLLPVSRTWDPTRK